MKCKKCGFEIKENKKFCSNCGWKIEFTTSEGSEKLPTNPNFGNLFDNLITQPVLILFVLLIKLFLDIDNFLIEKKDIIFTTNEFLILIMILQVIALFSVIIISIKRLYMKKSFSKFANYLYLALSISLLSTSIESLIFFLQSLSEI